jgi:hypothetical protein
VFGVSVRALEVGDGGRHLALDLEG